MENNVCIILTSVAAEEDASSIAAQLVESGLAACVQISARGTSVYRWQGAIQKDEEYFLQIKAMPCNELAVRQWLGKHHPYDTPEIMCLNAGASGKYIEWMRDNACKDKPTQ